MKRNKGFTMIELMISVVIVAILVIVSGAVYTNYVRKAKMSEGKVLLSSIADSLDVYFTETDEDEFNVAQTNYNTTINVDARRNEYFKNFKVEVSTLSGQKIHKITVIDTTGTVTMIMTIFPSSASDVSIIDNKNN